MNAYAVIAFKQCTRIRVVRFDSASAERTAQSLSAKDYSVFVIPFIAVRNPAGELLPCATP